MLTWRTISISAILGGAAVAITAALSGCSGASVVHSSVDPVAQAAEVSERLPGYEVKLSEQATGLPASEGETATGTGFFDARGKRGVMTLKLGSKTVEAQYSDLAEYTRVHGSSASALAHGRAWVKLDLREVAAALGIDYAVLSSDSGSSSPASELSYLRASSGEVLRIGSEDVEGVPTTHYRATIDWANYVALAPPAQRAAARASVATIERITGSSTQPVDVWVDAAHHVRRTEETIHECLPRVPGKVGIRVRYELSSFGVQRIPALPSSANVTDITPRVIKQLKGVKLGCSQS